MRGDNLIRPQELGDGRRLWVQEVFYTLQGEGPMAGEPALFVRLAGCNLRCFYCDTDFESSQYRPDLETLLAHIAALRPPVCDLVILTGGEPLRQNIAPLLRRLLADGLRVQIETAGTLFLDLPEDSRLFIICSPKTTKLHPEIVPRITAYKYVLAAGEVSAEDGLPEGSTQKPGAQARLARPSPGAMVYVMPRDDSDAEKNNLNRQACAAVAMKHGYKLTLQLHKLLGIS